MKKILIIEDDLFIRENVFEVLELSGYDVYAAANGKEGLDKAFEIMPDLIICDIMMPIMDGYEVRTKLAENLRTKAIPFVFLTAKTEIKELRHGMSLGADDYITKPFEVKDLLTSVGLRFEKIENLKDLFRIDNITGTETEPEINIKKDDIRESIQHNEIVVILGDGDCSEIVRADEARFEIRKNLKYWESILPENKFIRIQQTVIINTNYLESIEESPDGKHFARLKSFHEPLLIGTRHLTRVKNVFD